MRRYPISLICFAIAALFAMGGCAESIGAEGGPRIVTTDERNIYVDGKLFFVKGVSYSSDYGPKHLYGEIPKAIWEKDFEMIKKAGVNTIRTYGPLPVEMLDLAYKHGIMVIENVCYPSDRTRYDSAVDLEKLRREAITYVKRDKDHPAILMWSIWNDMPFTWGKRGNILHRYDRKVVDNFLKSIYDAIKEEDPNHPVTGSNIMEKVGEDIGFEFLDVLGVNAYLGISDWFDGKFDLTLAKSQMKKIERMTSLTHKKPGLIMETGYSTYCKRYSQGKVITTQIQAVGTKLAGVIIF